MKPTKVEIPNPPVIIVASSQTFATGINIKNLHSIIFAAPTKSEIRVLQSIGRGLRKSDDGRATTVYDISDNFSWKKKKNYTMTHAIDRIKIYTREGFDFKIIEIPLP
jgi:superfamily II DNA or RNA helicase